VGFPIVVNGDRKLLPTALERNWKVMRIHGDIGGSLTQTDAR
jgi:hypothetical protein